MIKKKIAKKPVKKTKGQLTKEYWKLKAEYIKKRDCSLYFFDDFLPCCSCGNAIEPFTGQHHAGHFLKQKQNIAKYDHRNIHSQCNRCNYLDGQARDVRVAIKYEKFLHKKYGVSPLDIFNSQFIEEKKRGSKWYSEHIMMMKQLLEMEGEAYDIEAKIQQSQIDSSIYSLLDEEAILLYNQ